MAKIITVGKGLSKYNVVISKNAITQKNLMAGLKAKNKILVITDSGTVSYTHLRAHET